MHALLRDAPPRGDEIQAACARAARIALAGVLAAPAALGLLSAAGWPLRVGAGPLFWTGALAGFGGAGWYVGRRLGVPPRRRSALAGAFLPAGLLAAPALSALQGLTGREPLPAVAAGTLLPFSVAFVAAGLLAARALRIEQADVRAALACAAGGLLGGTFAMLPFCWAWLRLDVPGESYLVMGLAIVGFLGGLIAPFHVVGLVLDRARRREVLRETDRPAYPS